jgi:hypothetical protein
MLAATTCRGLVEVPWRSQEESREAAEQAVTALRNSGCIIMSDFSPPLRPAELTLQLREVYYPASTGRTSGNVHADAAHQPQPATARPVLVSALHMKRRHGGLNPAPAPSAPFAPRKAAEAPPLAAKPHAAAPQHAMEPVRAAGVKSAQPPSPLYNTTSQQRPLPPCQSDTSSALNLSSDGEDDSDDLHALLSESRTAPTRAGNLAPHNDKPAMQHVQRASGALEPPDAAKRISIVSGTGPTKVGEKPPKVSSGADSVAKRRKSAK